MEHFTRITSRSLQGRSICSSCLRALRHQALPRQPNNHQTIPTYLRSKQQRQHRQYHTSPTLLANQQQSSQSNSQTQAHPLGDFYSDILSAPLPSKSRTTKNTTSSPSSPSTSLPSWVPTSNDQDRAERAAKLFGTIKGSGYERRTTNTSRPDETWQTINGVPVPPRPAEPENCCMSGCVHCVWDDYRDDIEEWAGRVKVARAKAGHGDGETNVSGKQAVKVQMPRQEVASAASSMDDDGGGSEGLWDAPATPSADGTADELFAGIPVGIREFMNVEKKIRERKRLRKGAAAA